MKSWTRTLNLDDAHSLLAMAEPDMDLEAWAEACYAQLPDLSMARRRELIRMIRDDFLEVDASGSLLAGLFLVRYHDAPAAGQIDLVQVQWALSHPLSLVAVEQVVAPALASGEREIPLEDVEALVAEHLETSSAESLRKTRTVLLGALEGIGVLETRGTGQHRALRAARSNLHPAAFGYLVLRDLAERGVDSMLVPEVIESGLGARLTQCGPAWARRCLAWNLERGLLVQRDDVVALAS